MGDLSLASSISSLRNKKVGPFGATALQGRGDRGREERGPPYSYCAAFSKHGVFGSIDYHHRTCMNLVSEGGAAPYSGGSSGLVQGLVRG